MPSGSSSARIERCRPSGVLLLAEPMMGTPGAETVGDAYFGFYLLAMGRGRPRTPRGFEATMLRIAGFADPHLVHTRQPLQVPTASSRANRNDTKVLGDIDMLHSQSIVTFRRLSPSEGVLGA